VFRRLLYLNGLAITGVVLFHSAGMGFVAMFSWAHRYLPAAIDPMTRIGSMEYFWLRFLEQVASFAIPAFLFVSGFFIAVAAGKTSHTISWKVVAARVKTLLIPYLLWTFVVMALQILLEGKRFTAGNLAVDLLIGRTNEILYFVPLLIQFYLISPVLVLFARQNWRLFLGVAAAIQLVIILLPYMVYLNLDIPNKQAIAYFVPKWFFLSRIFWFSAGIVVGFHLEHFKAAFHRLRRVGLVVALVSIPVGMLEWELLFRLSGETWLANRETLVDTLYALALITVVLGFQQARLPFEHGFERLGKDSYGIYLTHFLFIEYSAKIIYRFWPGLLGYQILMQPFWIFIGLALPVAMMALLNRSPARKWYTYIFG